MGISLKEQKVLFSVYSKTSLTQIPAPVNLVGGFDTGDSSTVCSVKEKGSIADSSIIPYC